MKNPTIKNCDFEIKVEMDDLKVRGNSLASGDDASDRRAENEIFERLGRDDIWAWAFVRVVCKWNGFTGEDCLGACSYDDEEDFKKPGGYYDDMKQRAFDAMIKEIKDVKNRFTMFSE